MIKAREIQIGTKELAVLINRSVRTARRYMVTLPSARKVSGKWVATLSVAEVRKLRAYAMNLARFVMKEVRDMQAGTDVCELQEMLDRAKAILRIVKSVELIRAADNLVLTRGRTDAQTIQRLIAA